MQFGRDYAGARDDYDYHCMLEAMQPDASNGELQTPGKIILPRVPKHRMDETGRNVSLNFTGGGRGKDNDSFNTVRVRLLPATGQ